MNYTRVLPRDLFNESKTLKCYGRLALLITDELTPCPMEIKGSGPFEIHQDQSDGSFYISNYSFYAKGNKLYLRCSLNSRSPYTMFTGIKDEIIEVFNDMGEFTEEFTDALISLNYADDHNKERAQKSELCSKVLRLMDEDFTYPEALNRVLKRFPSMVTRQELERELNLYI